MRGIPNFVREPVYAPLTLDGKDYPTLLDIGCELSLVPHHVVKGIKSLVMSPRKFTLHCADNARTPLHVIGEVTLPLALGGKPLPDNAFVSPDIPELTFGA